MKEEPRLERNHTVGKSALHRRTERALREEHGAGGLSQGLSRARRALESMTAAHRADGGPRSQEEKDAQKRRQAHGVKHDPHLGKRSEVLEPGGGEMLEDLWRRRGRGEGGADPLAQI